MIFSIKALRQSLNKTLSHIQTIIEKRNILSIHNNVRIIANDDGVVTFTSTDNLLVVIEQISCEVEKSGATTVNAGMLFDIIRKLDDNNAISLTIKAEEPSLLEVKSGKSNFKLSTLPVEQFTCIDGNDFTHNFSIPVKRLKELIDRTKIAICNEESRYNLNGINLLCKDKLLAVTTDGHRLCYDQISEEIDIKPNFPSIIIPKKTIFEIRKIFDDVEEDINISVSSSKIQLYCQNILIISRLIDAKFPDCSNLIPKDNNLKIIVDTKEFAKAIDRATVVLDEKSKGIKLIAKQNMLTLVSSSNNGNNCQENLEIESNIEEQIEIGYNARYLLEGLTAIAGNKVSFSVKDQFSAALIEDSASKDYKYILMPMRV